MFNEWVSITCLYYKEKLFNNLSNQQKKVKEKNLFSMHADKGGKGGGKHNMKGGGTKFKCKTISSVDFVMVLIIDW